MRMHALIMIFNLRCLIDCLNKLACIPLIQLTFSHFTQLIFKMYNLLWKNKQFGWKMMKSLINQLSFIYGLQFSILNWRFWIQVHRITRWIKLILIIDLGTFPWLMMMKMRWKTLIPILNVKKKKKKVCFYHFDSHEG